MMAVALCSSIVEWRGETEGGSNALAEAVGELTLLREDRPFRNFVIARSLLLCSALSALGLAGAAMSWALPEVT